MQYLREVEILDHDAHPNLRHFLDHGLDITHHLQQKGNAKNGCFPAHLIFSKKQLAHTVVTVMMKRMTITLVHTRFVITLFRVLIQVKYNLYISWMKFMKYKIGS